MTGLHPFERHEQVVRFRTLASIIAYVVFLVASTAAAAMGSSFNDPIAMATLVMAAVAFLLLPRSYIPPALAQQAHQVDFHDLVERLRAQERRGYYLRGAYLVGAVLAVLLLPMLMS